MVVDVALVERGRGRVKGEGERKRSLLLGKEKYSPCPGNILDRSYCDGFGLSCEGHKNP